MIKRDGRGLIEAGKENVITPVPDRELKLKVGEDETTTTVPLHLTSYC